MEESIPVAPKEMATSPINEVESKTNRMIPYTKQEKPQVYFFLGFVEWFIQFQHGIPTLHKGINFNWTTEDRNRNF